MVLPHVGQTDGGCEAHAQYCGCLVTAFSLPTIHSAQNPNRLIQDQSCRSCGATTSPGPSAHSSLFLCFCEPAPVGRFAFIPIDWSSLILTRWSVLTVISSVPDHSLHEK